MPERTWTDSQLDAISARNGTVLVAAAAGSGKTTVLVQRAIERLTDPDAPTPADRLLIVTFTKAAAAEMRSRLEKRLYELLRERPEDAGLRRQSILLAQAHIGTVDSFCAEMVREFFHLLDLSPEFRIVADRQEEELMASALEEVMQEAFEQGTVTELADAVSGERNDRRLTETVLTLYRFIQSHPFPEKWLRDRIELYEKGDMAPWEEVILRYAEETGRHCVRLLDLALEEAERDENVKGSFSPSMTAERRACLELAELAAAGDWDGAVRAQKSFALQRRKPLKGYRDDPLTARLDTARNAVKKAVEDLGKSLCSDREQSAEDLRATAALVRRLGELTLAFSRRYEERKRERNFLDYSDLEHCAIRLFCREDGGSTDTAAEVRDRFDEIMIDEYQDINEVQDRLFRAISRDGKNLFMVGDVKQSIYGFRQARPKLFLDCRRSFPNYDRARDEYPATVVLGQNFRSRREVTDAVNFVFSTIMSREAGDIDYTEEERLVCGADYPESEGGYETELLLVNRPSGVTAETAEAACIAERIREIVGSGLTVKADGQERPVGYGDFCVLLRSANQHAYAYAREMLRLGVPARASVAGGFFAAAEIRVMISLLQVIDNPDQDIPLLAVMMSPIYGFSVDDAARLRSEERKEPIYLSLLRAAETDGRCAALLRDIGQYRDRAATMPSDAFLTLLYGKTGYTDMVLAMEDGETRLANLRLLQRYARDYEASGYNGISGFVRYLERLRRSDSDLRAAELSPENTGTVSIMSIHRSKGLEFPVCIVAGCGREFVSDLKEDMLLHPDLGIGMRIRDRERSARYTTAVREAIGLKIAASSASEELRILYVAMTRAREKLILVGSGSKLEAAVAGLSLEVTEQGVTPYTVRKAKSAMQWLILCALCHPDGGILRRNAPVPAGAVREDCGARWTVKLTEYQPAEEAEPETETEIVLPDTELLERLRRQIAFRYPYEDRLGIPAKVAASKLAAEQAEGHEISLSRPAWLGEKGMTPAERGIALHEFMQFADFPAAAKDPERELERLVKKAYLTPEQAEAVDRDRVRKFFRSALGGRVLASPEVEKERRFTAQIPAAMAEPGKEISPGLPLGEETVLLQGAVDCTFVEDGKLHIIDFKTDRVESPEELWRRYGTQIRLYAYAMEEVTGMQVGELILYSTWLSTASGKLYREGELFGEAGKNA